MHRRTPFLVLGLAAAATTWLVPGALARLAWTRAAIVQGELWRLLTAHFAHASTAHLVVDLAALALVALLVGGQLTAPDWWLVALASALGSSLAVLWLSPATLAFAGLSAIVHGLLAGGCAAACLRRHPLGWLLGAGLIGKLVLERWQGRPILVALVPAPGIAIDAHLYAALAGAAAGFVLARRSSQAITASAPSAARASGPNAARSKASNPSGPAREGSEP